MGSSAAFDWYYQGNGALGDSEAALATAWPLFRAALRQPLPVVFRLEPHPSRPAAAEVCLSLQLVCAISDLTGFIWTVSECAAGCFGASACAVAL